MKSQSISVAQLNKTQDGIPKCLVLVASFNGERFLAEQLCSIQSQLLVEVDIVFSDDNSNDNSKVILENFKCKNINNAHNKHGSACNNFLFLIEKVNHEKYDYVFLADQDDIWFPRKLTEAINKMKEQKADCYSGSYYIFNEKYRTVKYRNKYFPQRGNEHIFRSPGPGFTYGFTKEAFSLIQSEIQNIDYIKIRFRWHDWLVYALAVHLDLQWFIDKNPYSLYRQHELNDTGQNTSLSGIIYRLKFLFGGAYRQEILKITEVINEKIISKNIRRFNINDRIKLIRSVKSMRSGKIERCILVFWLIFGMK